MTTPLPERTPPQTRPLRDAISNPVFIATLSSWLPDCSNMSRDDLCQEVILRGLAAEDLGKYRPERGSPMSFLLGIGFNIRCRQYEQAQLFQRYQCRSRKPEPARQPIDRLIAEENIGIVRCVASGFSPDDLALLIEDDDPDCEPRPPRTNRERARKFRMIREIRSAFPDWEAD